MRKLQIDPDTNLGELLVYLITLDKVEVFSNQLNTGASDMAKLTGINYIWDAPAARVVEEQISVIRQAVANGADLIMLQALDTINVSVAVEEAKASGTKIIYVDAPAVEEAIVILATDNYSAGQMAGELMINQLESEGILSGPIGVIDGIPEMTTRLNRQFGFRDIIVRDGKYQLLPTRYAQGNPVDIQNSTEAFINENPDLAGLFATYEGATIGMGYALMDMNKPIIGIGFDIADVIRDMINNDVLIATLVQNPYTMTWLGMAQAIAALTGNETGPRFINTGISMVTKYGRNVIT
ncbi:substrate-binding domain-containing protein [Clostridium sp. Marseille-P2415]|uniref:substrate-binding domain-containing protein n=1 Tax=Clostridium sp. Marseille-P2415 TaxID=1805471 RepID=UPI00098891E5|nr:substrate-binding domain-containing protein [Clostridium sp. Marseille-P2415]